MSPGGRLDGVSDRAAFPHQRSSAGMLRLARPPAPAVIARVLVLIGLALALIADTSTAATRRVALVVGAGNYAHAGALAHTLDDARELAAALTRLDFDVDLVLNPDRAALEHAVRRLGQRSHGADAALFYYSGHALEALGINWLLPVSADVQSDGDLRFEALDLAAVLEQMEGSARVSLVFLDACREDPFKQRLSVARDLNHSGLSASNAGGSGTFIAFATAPGMVAADGTGPHSPFTAALLKYIETGGLEIRQMMSKVRGDVEAATDNKQVPWDSSSLRGDFYFNPSSGDERVIQAINAANPQVDLDALFWESVKNSKNPKDFSAYLQKFPQGVFAEVARNRLAEMKAPPVVPSAPLNPQLMEALNILAASSTEKSREDAASAYQAGREHKAIVVHLATGVAMWVMERPSAQEAEESGLERCEVYAGVPCVLVAVDDSIKYASGDTVTTRPMPRVHYAGPFDPERVPSVMAEVRRRPDVVGYRSAPDFKAIAYHPNGGLFVVNGADSQRAAEQQALAACNGDPVRHGRTGPCYLYASGGDVVLSRHSRTPIAVVVADSPAAKPAPVFSKPNTVPFHDALLIQLERAMPAMTAPARDTLARNYEAAAVHKALALHLKNGGTYRFVGFPSADAAEQTTLEGCAVYYGEACALLAVDDVVRAEVRNGLSPSEMPRVRYAGAFDPDQIPGISPALRSRRDIQAYAAAPAAKAIALHPWGHIFVVTGAGTQNEAEARALAACNEEHSRGGKGGPCYLYASANEVVLTRRLREPLTPAAATAAPSPHAAAPPRPVSPGDVALKDALIQRIAETTQLPPDSIENDVRQYLALNGHRAIAAGAHMLATAKHASLENAETIALERCQLAQGAVCALMGSDRDVAPAAPPAGSKWAPRDMPSVSYAGTFEVRYIPGVDDAVRKRPDLLGYNVVRSPKAAAISAGRVVVATIGKTQFDAESRVLAACGVGCLLYAAGNRVVLPQRWATARPLGTSLVEVLSYLEASDRGAKTNAEYSKVRPHKSMASLPEAVRLFTWGGLPSAEDAERLALEACDLQYNAGCITVVTDDMLRTTDPSAAARPAMTRLTYQGPYRPDMVPLFVGPPHEALDYVNLPEPKAMAIRPSGPKIAIGSGSTLAEAEAQALARCTDSDSPFPCFLYAANEQTILPQRRTEPQQ